jgi:hypothetical protein
VERVDTAIGPALSLCARDVEADRPRAWRIDLGNGVPLPARARLRDQWLEITAPIEPEPQDVDRWTLLVRNGALPGPARVVGIGAGLALRADVPVHDRRILADRLPAACEAIRQWQRAAGDPDRPSAATQSLPEVERERWIAAAAEFGRDITAGPGGRLTAGLPVAGRDGQARIAVADGGVTVGVRVARCEPPDPTARIAIGTFLLRGTGALSLVRAAVRPGAGPATAAAQIVLEVSLPRLVDGVELDAALSALTVACRHSARETRALTDARLARAYLDHTTKEAQRATR